MDKEKLRQEKWERANLTEPIREYLQSWLDSYRAKLYRTIKTAPYDQLLEIKGAIIALDSLESKIKNDFETGKLILKEMEDEFNRDEKRKR